MLEGAKSINEKAKTFFRVLKEEQKIFLICIFILVILILIIAYLFYALSIYACILNDVIAYNKTLGYPIDFQYAWSGVKISVVR